MRNISGCAIGLAAMAVITAPSARAFTVTPTVAPPTTVVLSAGKKQARQGRDCTPYNGPYGFYGNVWCQPPSEMSYLRNLSSPWPQQTPPALKKVKPDTSADW